MLPDSALEEVKRDLRSMLISEKGGVPLKNIQRDYEMLSCNRLPFKELGFNDVQAFMRSIPDVARESRGPAGDVTYFAVCDASTSHIQKLVSSQRSKKKKAPKFSVRGRGGGGGGRGRGGISRGFFRGGRGGALLPRKSPQHGSGSVVITSVPLTGVSNPRSLTKSKRKGREVPSFRPDPVPTPTRPRPPQNMRGGGRWQRGGGGGGAMIPRASTSADPSSGQSGDWRNKGSVGGGGLSTFVNTQRNNTTMNDDGKWGGSRRNNNYFTDESVREWDKENNNSHNQSSSSSNATSPIVTNLRIGIDNKGNRTIDKDNKSFDLREQINKSRTTKKSSNIGDSSYNSNNNVNNDRSSNSNHDNNTNVFNEGEMMLSGDLRHQLNALRNTYTKAKEEKKERDDESPYPARGGGASNTSGRSNVGNWSSDRGPSSGVNGAGFLRRDISAQEGGGGGGGGKRGNQLPKQSNNSNKVYPKNDVPPRFRKQQGGGGGPKHDGCFGAQEVKAARVSPIQHTETFEDKTESKNWVPPEHGPQYLEAFHNYFLSRRLPTPAINVVMGKVERQKGFYGQINYEDKLYYPLEILRTEDEARQNAARAFCLKMGISLPAVHSQPRPHPPAPSSLSPISPSTISSSPSSSSSPEVEAVRKKIYNIVSTTGIFANSLPAVYKQTYGEDLDPDFMSSLRQATHLFNIEEPVTRRYIIYKVPEAMVKLAQVVQMEVRRSEEPSASLQLPPLLPDVGSQLDVLFSYAYSGDEIYLQKAEHEELLYQIEEVLQTLSELAPPSPGTDLTRCLIAACYEGGWYRAKVRTTGTDNTVSVSFVDYGNREDVTTANVRLLPNDKLVTVTPPLALPCCLQKPTGAEWKDDVASYFLSLSETEPVLSAKVLAHKENLCVVELYSRSGECLNNKVTRPATPDPNPSIIPTPPTPTTNYNTPTMLNNPITYTTTPSSPPPSSPFPPTTTAAASHHTPSSSSTPADIPTTAPLQAAPVVPSMAPADTTITNTATTIFSSPTTAAAAALATPEIQSLTSASTMATSAKQKRLFAEDPDPLCPPETNFFAVYVCRVLTESSVLLRIVDDEYSDKLDELESEIAERFASWPVPTGIHKSNVYACLLLAADEGGSEDNADSQDNETPEGNKFYRVRVIHTSEELCECYLLDHGDYETVHKDQLREIDSTLNASLPYQAILATLHGLDTLLPEHHAVAVEALIKLTISEGSTFMALRYDTTTTKDASQSNEQQELKEEGGGEDGGGGSKKNKVDPVVLNRVRKIMSCLSDVDPAKVVKIYQDVYQEKLENVEETIRHIPGYGFWKKSLDVELVDTNQEDDVSVNKAIFTILTNFEQLRAEGKDGMAALHNYFGSSGPDSSTASVDGGASSATTATGITAAADITKMTVTREDALVVDTMMMMNNNERNMHMNIMGNLANSLDQRLHLTPGVGVVGVGGVPLGNTAAPAFVVGGNQPSSHLVVANGGSSIDSSNSNTTMDRVYSYVQEQADSVAVASSSSSSMLPALSVSSSNYPLQQQQQQQQQPSPSSSSNRSLYTWSTNVNNVKDAAWMSSQPLSSPTAATTTSPGGLQHLQHQQAALTNTQQHEHPPRPNSADSSSRSSVGGGGGDASSTPLLPLWYSFELNNFSPLFILHAESPSDFVAIPYDLRQPLLDMEAALAKHFSATRQVADVLSTNCLYGVNRDGLWHRTLYISSIEHLHRVLYPDYHQYDTVSLDQLFPLPAQFYILPFLGRKMALGGIAPTSQDWPESVKFWFIQNTRHKSMYGLIWDHHSGSNDNSNDDDSRNSRKVPKPLRTQLVDTSGDEDVIVDDVLCDKGWARHISVE